MMCHFNKYASACKLSDWEIKVTRLTSGSQVPTHYLLWRLLLNDVPNDLAQMNLLFAGLVIKLVSLVLYHVTHAEGVLCMVNLQHNICYIW